MVKVNRKINYAIVGLNDLAKKLVLPSFVKSDNSLVSAIFDNDLASAKKEAKKYHIPYVFELVFLEEMIVACDIEAIYITDPIYLDQSLIVLIDEYKLHFICEPALGLGPKETEELSKIMIKNNTKSMIAYHFQFDDAFIETQNFIKQGGLGNLKFINNTFNYAIKDDFNLRFKHPHDLTSNALYKIGINCIHLARLLFKEEPIQIGAFSTTSDNPRYINIEETTSAIMKFSNDRLANFMISFGSFTTSDVEISGEYGRITIDNAFSVDLNCDIKIQVRGKKGLVTNKEEIPPRHSFKREIHTFSDCIINYRPVPFDSITDSIKNVKIIEAIIEAINLKKQIKLNADGSFVKQNGNFIVGNTVPPKSKYQIEMEKRKN